MRLGSEFAGLRKKRSDEETFFPPCVFPPRMDVPGGRPEPFHPDGPHPDGSLEGLRCGLLDFGARHECGVAPELSRWIVLDGIRRGNRAAVQDSGRPFRNAGRIGRCGSVQDDRGKQHGSHFVGKGALHRSLYTAQHAALGRCRDIGVDVCRDSVRDAVGRGRSPR